MKGKTPLFNNNKSKFRFKLDIQLFSTKRVSDIGIKLQNSVENQKLKNLFGELYREGAVIGDGSAMAAANEQFKTGKLVGGRDHIIKIKERIKNLKNILKTQNLSVNDTKLANELLDKMEKSLKGEYQ